MDILVVDDDPEILQLVKTFLEVNGYNVLLAEKAQVAYEFIETKRPQLVLLDMRLPDQDGIDVLRNIKTKYPEISVVMMTGFKEAELVVEAFRQGAMDCLLKPFNFEYLKLHILSRFNK